MLYLNAESLIKAASPNEIMDAIEKAYQIEDRDAYHMPHRIHIDYQRNTVLYMPCFLETLFGTKLLTLFPDNAAKGEPVINGLVLLNSLENGAPLALLDGGRLTALRTGAVGAVAVRHLAPQTAERAGLIGAGIQGFYQLLFASHARCLKQITVFDLDAAKAEDLCRRLKMELPDVSMQTAASGEELLRNSEIIITATPAEKPVLPDDGALLKNKLFIGIGSYKPEMREFPEALYRLLDHVYVDTLHGLEETGDLITPLHHKWIQREQVIPFARFLGDGEGSNLSGKQTKLFKSVGMALFDIVVGELLYRNALAKQLGTELN